MKRLLLMLLVVIAAGYTSEENEGGTPIPGHQCGAPLYDEAAPRYPVSATSTGSSDASSPPPVGR